MESVLKKIFDGKKDDLVHNEFTKYSRGVFSNKYLVDAKKQADRYNIKTGAEFANFLVRKGLEKANGETEITGVIIATFDVSKDAEFPIEGIKQFMGIKQAKVNTKIAPEKIISLMDKYPKAFFALTFKLDDYELKIKEKAPKSAKPSTKGETEIKADFCSLKTSDSEIIKDLFFDCPNFNEIKINHTLEIIDITLPNGEKDPVKMRENAIRKGKIIRKVTIDGSVKISEKNFEA